MSETFICPSCGEELLPLFAKFNSVSLPPTGGDYEWSEGDEEFNCSKCKEYLSARVRRTLGGEFISISSLGFGSDPNWYFVRMFWLGENRLLLERNEFVEILEYSNESWEQIFFVDKVRYIKSDLNHIVLANSKKYKIFDKNYKLLMEYDSTNEYWYTLNLEYYFENQFIKGGISDVQKFRIHLVDFMKDKIIKKKIDLPSSSYTTNLFISEDNRYLISCFFTSFNTFNEIQIWEVQKANLKLLKNVVLPFSNFEYCIFDEDFIYMIDLYNTKGTGFHDQMPYRILVFDLNSLELKQIIDDLNAKICPKDVYLKSVQKTKSNQWIWCTDKIYILNAKLELEKEIYFNLDYYPRISIQKEGNFLSVNKNNDVFILDLVKDTVYSLKEKSFV